MDLDQMLRKTENFNDDPVRDSDLGLDSWIVIQIIIFKRQLYWLRYAHQMTAPFSVEVCAVPVL